MSRYTSMEHLRFLLHEVHTITDLFKYPRFSHLEKEQVDMLIQSAKDFADRDLYPFFREMDQQPVQYDGKGGVETHPQLQNIIRNGAAQGWISGTAKFEHGGMQLPIMVYNAAHHIFAAANNGAQGYLGLSTGASALITSFGSQEQIDTYVPPIYTGKWQGTMALTEPQAGSALTDITTLATPTANEGFYKIKGQKIFISAGQHQATENFVHLTLARIQGAPAGVKGISLFIIPKFIPQPDGTLITNDVFCAGDFQKLGQRGYATTHLVFGDNNGCMGWLVGEPNKGLSYMFQMMNEARIGVGQTAASVAMAAYQASLQYAKERPQGRRPDEKDPNKAPIHIIKHADVQRMLLTQKAIAEGSLSLAMECNRLVDLCQVTEGDEKDRTTLLLEILTPIIKTYASEQGNRSTALAIQIFGGYGYTVDFPVEQYYRDMRIMAIYEGTTGIQSLDLLGRKVTMQKGKAYQMLEIAIGETIDQAASHDSLTAYSVTLKEEMVRLTNTIQELSKHLTNKDLERYLADATIFMEMAGYVVIAWQWLKQAVVAQTAISKKDYSAQSHEFYEGKILTMKFFFRYELPHAEACSKTLLNPEFLTNLENHDILN